MLLDDAWRFGAQAATGSVRGISHKEPQNWLVSTIFKQTTVVIVYGITDNQFHLTRIAGKREASRLHS